MFDARDVAPHLVRIGCPPDAEGGVLFTPLRLQKLLYSCQGWHLALLGEPLFRQPIEAWRKGPVVRDVYEQFVGTRDAVTPAAIGEPTEPISETVAGLLRMVWREYAKYTPEELVEMKHREPAWTEARAGLPGDAQSSNPLSAKTMTAFFAEVARKAVPASRFPALDPAEVWRADFEFERGGGRGVPAAEAMRRAKAARPA